MGAQLSKAGVKAETAAEKPGEAAASPAKTNGQVNDILPRGIHRWAADPLLGGGEECAPRAQSVRNRG